MIWNQRAFGAALCAALLLMGGVAVAEEEGPEVDPAEEAVAEEELEVEEAEEELEEEVDPFAEAEELAEEDEEEAAAAEKSDAKPWAVTASARMNVGQGTFARVSNDTQWAGVVDDGAGAFNSVTASFSINPSYRWERFTFASSLSFTQHLSATGMNAPYEGRFGDIGINTSMRFDGWTLDQLGGVRLTPSASVNIPLLRSAPTRVSTFRGSGSAGLGASKTFFGNLTLSYNLSGSRSFHDYTSPIVDVGRIGEENAVFRADGAEAVAPGMLAIGGRINTPWSLNNSLSASFRLGKVSTSISYAYTRSWSYVVNEHDEFSSMYQCETRCSSDRMRGSISLSYRLNDTFTVSGGIASGGAPKTADQRTFNFPFWNFESPVGPSGMNIGISGRY